MWSNPMIILVGQRFMQYDSELPAAFAWLKWPSAVSSLGHVQHNSLSLSTEYRQSHTHSNLGQSVRQNESEVTKSQIPTRFWKNRLKFWSNLIWIHKMVHAKEERRLIHEEIQEINLKHIPSFLVSLIFTGSINNVGLGSPSFDVAV